MAVAIPKAKLIYGELCDSVKAEGKCVSPLGISVNRLLSYLELTEDNVRDYVKDELELNQLQAV